MKFVPPLGVLHKMHAKEEREGRILHAFFHSTISKLFSVKAYGMGFLIGLVGSPLSAN
jgi:hypothetical protein